VAPDSTLNFPVSSGVVPVAVGIGRPGAAGHDSDRHLTVKASRLSYGFQERWLRGLPDSRLGGFRPSLFVSPPRQGQPPSFLEPVLRWDVVSNSVPKPPTNSPDEPEKKGDAARLVDRVEGAACGASVDRVPMRVTNFTLWRRSPTEFPRPSAREFRGNRRERVMPSAETASTKGN